MERTGILLLVSVACVGLVAADPQGRTAGAGIPVLGAVLEPVRAIQHLDFADLEASRTPDRLRRSLARLRRAQHTLDPARWRDRLRKTEARYLKWQRRFWDPR